jgi:hypothetical protein
MAAQATRATRTVTSSAEPPKPERRGQRSAASSAQPELKRPQHPNASSIVKQVNQRSGYKNNWHRKELNLRDRVTFPNAFPKAPSVAIIGGGLSGLVCSLELAKQGIRSTIFDTGALLRYTALKVGTCLAQLAKALLRTRLHRQGRCSASRVQPRLLWCRCSKAVPLHGHSMRMDMHRWPWHASPQSAAHMTDHSQQYAGHPRHQPPHATYH